MMRRVAGLLASAIVVGGIVVACRPSGDVGYVQINTVPVAPITHAVAKESVGNVSSAQGFLGGARQVDVSERKPRIWIVHRDNIECGHGSG